LGGKLSEDAPGGGGCSFSVIAPKLLRALEWDYLLGAPTTSKTEIILVTLEAIATIAGHTITFQMLTSLQLHIYTLHIYRFDSDIFNNSD